MSTKQQYLDVLTQSSFCAQRVQDLESTVQDANNYSLITEFTAIFDNIAVIKSWAQGEIDNINQQESVINNFLVDLKALFTQYEATVEIAKHPVGFGESYGEDELNIKFTATQSGVTGSKEFVKNILASEDLV